MQIKNKATVETSEQQRPKATPKLQLYLQCHGMPWHAPPRHIRRHMGDTDEELVGVPLGAPVALEEEYTVGKEKVR